MNENEAEVEAIIAAAQAFADAIAIGGRGHIEQCPACGGQAARVIR